MPLGEFNFSLYGSRSSTPSPVGRMMAEFASEFRDGIDINLGVGYVNEDTIPARGMADALSAVLADPARYRLPFNYGGPAGSANLTGSIRRFLLNDAERGLTPEVLDECRIIVGPAGATSLLDGIGRVVEPGIVITTDPMYYIYCEYLQRSGFDIIAIPEDDDGMRVDLLTQKLASLGERRREIRFLYVVTVNNPSCTILANDRLRRLVEIAMQLSRDTGHAVPVFFDRAYEDLVHDHEAERCRSALLYDEMGVVHEIGTLSKVLAPALRVGYMVGKPSAFMDAMVQRTSDCGFSAPVITQEIASYMLDHHLAEQIASVRSGYREKARAVGECIDRELGEFLSGKRGGRAGFYYYLTFRDVDTREGGSFFRYLSRTTGNVDADGAPGARLPRVIYIPGSICVHPEGDMVEEGKRQLRISYGFEETARICEAIRYVREAAQYALNSGPSD